MSRILSANNDYSTSLNLNDPAVKDAMMNSWYLQIKNNTTQTSGTLQNAITQNQTLVTPTTMNQPKSTIKVAAPNEDDPDNLKAVYIVTAVVVVIIIAIGIYIFKTKNI